MEKSINGKDYMASAKGIVPLKALFANREEELNDYERIKLTVSLDQADLSILPFVSDQIDWALGPTKGKLEITGTPAHPSRAASRCRMVRSSSSRSLCPSRPWRPRSILMATA